MDHLRKIYGPTFSAEMELNIAAGTSPSPDRSMAVLDGFRSPQSAAIPAPSKSTFPSIASPSISNAGAVGPSRRPQDGQPNPELASTVFAGDEHQISPTGGISAAATSPVLAASPLVSLSPRDLVAHLQATQDLVVRFERRLLVRETELIKMEEEARSCSAKAEKLLVESQTAADRKIAHVS